MSAWAQVRCFASSRSSTGGLPPHLPIAASSWVKAGQVIVDALHCVRCVHAGIEADASGSDDIHTSVICDVAAGEHRWCSASEHDTEPELETEQDAWEAAFELYRTHVIV